MEKEGEAENSADGCRDSAPGRGGLSRPICNICEPMLRPKNKELLMKPTKQHVLVIIVLSILMFSTSCISFTGGTADVDSPVTPGPAGGLIVARKDGMCFEMAPASIEWTMVAWGGEGIRIDTELAIGSGWENTERIVNTLGDGNYAAKLCYDLVVEHNGVIYDDWFLPSADELKEMRYQRNTPGFEFSRGYYWSSTEALIGAKNALTYGRGDEDYNSHNTAKSYNMANVRPMRMFPCDEE